MLKRLIIFILLASNIIIAQVASTEDLTCEKDGKVSLAAGKYCCCTKDKDTDTEEHYTCKPTDPIEETDANGNKVKKCPKGQTRVSTKTHDTCTCELTIKK